MTSIDNVTVLGTGVLGSQIAYQTAYSGFEVIVFDISDEILETARKRFAGLGARYEQEVAGRPTAPPGPLWPGSGIRRVSQTRFARRSS
jgi:3-hydroxyacyl-CoA dehydrogenase